MLLALLACAAPGLPPGTTPAASTGAYGPAPMTITRAAAQSDYEAAPLTQSPTGLKYWVLRAGSGEAPRPGQTVWVHYTGWLASGAKFDSSFDRGQPLDFVLGEGRVIKGWEEAVATMRVGERRRLEIPPSLGYGERGAGGMIPPGATLVFEVELVAVR